MKKKVVKFNLLLIVVIGILVSLTYNPSNAKYYKEEQKALLYKASFNQMGGYDIDVTSSGMGLQDNSSIYNIHYKFQFVRSNDRKVGEVDNYSLALPNNCIVNYDDGNKSVDGSTITFNDNDLNSQNGKVTVNVTCPLESVTTADNNINLSINVKQQFTNGTVNERTYDYAIGEYNINKDEYLKDKIDKLEGKVIYLIKSNPDPIYGRFVKLLKEYINKNEVNFNEALAEYLVNSKTLDNLLDEYLSSIFTNGTDNISVSDLTNISGITHSTSINNKYNELTIGEDFIKGFKHYFDLRKDFLKDNSIYLSKANNNDIYNRFVKLLKDYIKNNEISFNDALAEYLESNTLDSLLNEYLESLYTTETDNLGINDLLRENVIDIGIDTSYNELIINSQFKDEFKHYFDLKDYIVGNTIRISKLNTENIEERIKNLLDQQDTNITYDEINLYIRDYLEEEKRETPSQYDTLEELSYSESLNHHIITVGPNFSSYVKTYYNNKNLTNRLKNFYFFNKNLSSSERNALFYKYLDKYLYKEGTDEFNKIQNYIKDNDVIDLAKSVNRDYFSYNESTYAIQLTARLYDILANGESYLIQKSFISLNRKISKLKEQLETSIGDKTIRDAILNDSNLQNIIAEDDLNAAIDETITITSGTNNIELKITSVAGVNEIIIKINIISTTNNVINSDISTDVDSITSSTEESNEEKIPALEANKETETTKEDEETKENVEATDPEVDVDTKTQDEVGIISYPIDSTLDKTLDEEKKYMYIKPEDE